MSKYNEESSEKEILAKEKRQQKKVKSKSFTSEIKNAVDKKRASKRQSY